ncbi:MAG: hypothetical protein RBQ71_05710 [Acholeplasmataceae bacterium]|jgi:hypothetical protein|nr:hypothetical protein [Acholeplasmataceae bacterium]
MIFLYIGLPVLVVFLILYTVQTTLQKKKSEQVKTETRHVLESYGKLQTEHHHLILEINDQKYQILYYVVPVNQELTINSKIIWEIRGSGKSLLVNQKHFLSSPYPKIVIVYPTEMKMKRYINENEMEFITYKRMFYNMYVIRPEELEALLKEISHA